MQDLHNERMIILKHVIIYTYRWLVSNSSMSTIICSTSMSTDNIDTLLLWGVGYVAEL